MDILKLENDEFITSMRSFRFQIDEAKNRGYEEGHVDGFAEGWNAHVETTRKVRSLREAKSGT